MTSTWIDAAWQHTVDSTLRTAQRISDSFPHVVLDGAYDQREAAWWTAGFWPGLLWLVYRSEQRNELLPILASCERQLEECLHDTEAVDHDLGFIWLLSGVASYGLTGEQDSRRRSLLAANLLSARFHLSGRFIRAWNFESTFMDTRYVAIIDSMMNLPLLHWASAESRDSRFAEIAVAHADTVASEFVRSDGSISHVMEFLPGQTPIQHGGQGYAPGSAWARGTSWAVYGFALSYGWTRNPRDLQVAEGAADFFLAELGDDIVPYWDFRAPEEHRIAWDSSASAIVASGLLELARYSTKGEKYKEAAERILKGLYEQYTSPAGEEGIITKGTVHYPEQKYLNVPIIYGDYFFAEALAKLRGEEGFFSLSSK
ncbi:glycoside hydrolase family 88 protein [Paenibacillus sp. FSL K6-1230]|uniref:glycoside hydrolase family 88 protein n=1 Tax=Paenibacillus sp. FSL K6-1230 TaxID=2921603 RepID=UPI0030F97E72